MSVKERQRQTLRTRFHNVTLNAHTACSLVLDNSLNVYVAKSNGGCLLPCVSLLFLMPMGMDDVQTTSDEADKDTNLARAKVDVEEIGHYSTGTPITLWNAGGMAPGGTAAGGCFGRTVGSPRVAQLQTNCAHMCDVKLFEVCTFCALYVKPLAYTTAKQGSCSADRGVQQIPH